MSMVFNPATGQMEDDGQAVSTPVPTPAIQTADLAPQWQGGQDGGIASAIPEKATPVEPVTVPGFDPKALGLRASYSNPIISGTGQDMVLGPEVQTGWDTPYEDRYKYKNYDMSGNVITEGQNDPNGMRDFLTKGALVMATAGILGPELLGTTAATTGGSTIAAPSFMLDAAGYGAATAAPSIAAPSFMLDAAGYGAGGAVADAAPFVFNPAVDSQLANVALEAPAGGAPFMNPDVVSPVTGAAPGMEYGSAATGTSLLDKLTNLVKPSASGTPTTQTTLARPKLFDPGTPPLDWSAFNAAYKAMLDASRK